MALAEYCMIISCLGSAFLLFVGILVATGSHLIHEKPKNRAMSAWMLILAAVLYMIIFGLTIYFKYLAKVRQQSAENWMKKNLQNNNKGGGKYVEMQQKNNYDKQKYK